MIPFIIISSVIISILIKVFKSSVKRVKDAIDDPMDEQNDINKDSIQNSLKQLDTQKQDFVTCEYCGTSQSKNKEKCSSCGASLHR